MMRRYQLQHRLHIPANTLSADQAPAALFDLHNVQMSFVNHGKDKLPQGTLDHHAGVIPGREVTPEPVKRRWSLQNSGHQVLADEKNGAG